MRLKGCEGQGLDAGMVPSDKPSPGNNHQQLGLGCCELWPDAAGLRGRRCCLGSAPTSASLGLPRDGWSWENQHLAAGRAASPGWDPHPLLCPGSLTFTLCSEAQRLCPTLQSCPGAAPAPTRAHRLGKGNPPHKSISLSLLTRKTSGKGMSLLKLPKCWAQLGEVWSKVTMALQEGFQNTERRLPACL